MKNKKKTDDAVEILHNRYVKDKDDEKKLEYIRKENAFEAFMERLSEAIRQSKEGKVKGLQELEKSILKLLT